MGKVLAIYICAEKGQPMTSVQSVRAIPGVGLEGDRYATGKGAYSKSKRVTTRHVSLISREAIEAANAELSVPFAPEETRRNILVEGIDLNSLVGKAFRVGRVLMRGVEWCDPCTRPTILSGKPEFEKAFAARGGLRAELFDDHDDVISVGDGVEEGI